MEKIICNIDGACKGNPGKGSIGGVLKLFSADMSEELNYRNYSHLLPGTTTNNKAEMLSALNCLKLIQPKKGKKYDITIKSDSNLVVRGMNEWIRQWGNNMWLNSQKKPVVNAELWQQLLVEKERLEAAGCVLRFEHIPREENSEADGLCNAAFA